MGAVISHDRSRAGEADKELVERAMRMFSSYLFARHPKNHEVALGQKRKAISDLPGGEVPAEILDDRLIE
jgi:hypothetical protein